jgi:hypothetical protein
MIIWALTRSCFTSLKLKAWRVNELVILTIHVTKVAENVINMLTIDILPTFSNGHNNHVYEIKTNAV